MAAMSRQALENKIVTIERRRGCDAAEPAPTDAPGATLPAVAASATPGPDLARALLCRRLNRGVERRGRGHGATRAEHRGSRARPGRARDLSHRLQARGR